MLTALRTGVENAAKYLGVYNTNKLQHTHDEHEKKSDLPSTTNSTIDTFLKGTLNVTSVVGAGIVLNAAKNVAPLVSAISSCSEQANNALGSGHELMCTIDTYRFLSKEDSKQPEILATTVATMLLLLITQKAIKLEIKDAVKIVLTSALLYSMTRNQLF
jgi:hypothetical protein